jgi:hypothetical protein
MVNHDLFWVYPIPIPVILGGEMVSALFITVNAFSITPTVAPYDLLYERIGIGVKLLLFINEDFFKTESAF